MDDSSLADVAGELALLAERVRCDPALVPSGLVDGRLAIERAASEPESASLNAALSGALDEVLAAACTATSHAALRQWTEHRIEELDANADRLPVGSQRARVDARRLVFECLSMRLRTGR